MHPLTSVSPCSLRQLLFVPTRRSVGAALPVPATYLPVRADTVNVASRMESSSEAGRLHCSAAFAALLARQWPEAGLEARGPIQIKGKVRVEDAEGTACHERTQLQPCGQVVPGRTAGPCLRALCWNVL